MKKKTTKRIRRAARYARGNMDVSRALIRCALACSVFILLAGALSISGAYARMPEWAALLVQTAMTGLCFLLPSWYGLFCADGDQREKLCRRALSAGQMVSVFAAGALLVCPMTLTGNLIAAPFARMGIAAGASSAPPFALFLPLLVKSALIVPVCEELFFRGYFHAVLREAGSRRASLLTSAFFALVHGVDAMLLPRFAMGLLLCALMEHSQSLLACVVLHAAYNLMLVLLSFFGLGALFSQLGFVSCLVRLAGCAAFVFALKQAYMARRAPNCLEWGRAMTLRQILLVCVSLAALLYVPLLLYVL